MLTSELAADDLDRDRLGLLVARLLAVCDLLYAESVAWVDRIKLPGPKPVAEPDPAGLALLERYADQLGELSATEAAG